MRRFILVLGVMLWAAMPAAAQGFGPALSRTEAMIATGQYAQAVAAGRAAYRAAATPAEKVAAARLIASAHFRQQQWARASIWLRIAAERADDPAQIGAIALDFAGLRAASPWDVQLSLSLAPSSNINNGSLSDTVVIWGLPFTLNPDARALAGWERAAGLRLAYRLADSPTARTEIGVAASSRNYWLTPAAAAAAPTVSGSDYAFAGVELFADHSWRRPGRTGSNALGATLGRTWYGGAPYTGYGRLRFAQSGPVAPLTGGQWAVTLERQQAQASGALSTVGTLEAGLDHQMPGGALRFSAAIEGTRSTDPLTENDALRLSLGYAPAQPVLGGAFSAEIGFEHRRWPLSVYDPAGRIDRTLSAGLRLVMTQADFYGFSPSVGLDARRTASNVSLFQRQSVGLRLGLDTRF